MTDMKLVSRSRSNGVEPSVYVRRSIIFEFFSLGSDVSTSAGINGAPYSNKVQSLRTLAGVGDVLKQARPLCNWVATLKRGYFMLIGA
jgi:hypothetical protein